MKQEHIGINAFANSLAMKKSDGTCVEILNSYVYNRIKYVNFIKPGTTEVQKLSLKEFHHIYQRIQPDHLRKILIPAYNIAVQRNLFAVDTDVDSPNFEVNHRVD